jgi:hypothetical protein
MSYDAWKTTDPADNTLGRSHGTPTRYWCLTCGWRGEGSIARSNHWQKTGHPLIVPNDDPRAKEAGKQPARKVG